MITNSGFKKVPGFEYYWCSEFGDIYSTYGNKIKKLSAPYDKYGYLRATLCASDRRHDLKVHQVVAKTFIGEIPKNMVVNHKDGNRTNNRFENLEYCTPADNERHARRVLGKRLLGEKASRSKLSNKEVLMIRKLADKGMNQIEIAKKFNIGQVQVSRIVLRKNWSHI